MCQTELMVDTLGASKAAWRAANGHPSRCSISAEPRPALARRV